MEGDEDEEDVDDIEHEFKINNEDEEKINKNTQIAEAMLHGKMSYGRGPDHDHDDNSTCTLYPPVISGGRSRPVYIIYIYIYMHACMQLHVTIYLSIYISEISCMKMQVSGEFPISTHAYGDQNQMLSSSLHKRVHPYPVSEPGILIVSLSLSHTHTHTRYVQKKFPQK